MKYVIESVSETVRDINTKYGPMKVYKLKLENEAEIVEYMISPKTDAPSIGDILNGTIGHNDFGAYFKKDKVPYTPGSIAGPSKVANTDAMYTAYAKDLFIAYMNAVSWDFTKLDEVTFHTAMQVVGDAAEILRNMDKEMK